MILGKDCNNILTMHIANTFFNTDGIVVFEKVTPDVIDIIGEMIWDKIEFNNSDNDYII